MIAGGVPILPARCRGTDGHPVPHLGVPDVGAILDRAALGLDFQNVLKNHFFVAEEGPVPSVQLPKYPVFSAGHERWNAIDIDQNLLHGLVQVERLRGYVLTIPDDLSRILVQRQRRVA
jgi:hypothetical protein